MAEYLDYLKHPRLHLVPLTIADSPAELRGYISYYFDLGYEGTIIRNPKAPYKPGRAYKGARNSGA